MKLNQGSLIFLILFFTVVGSIRMPADAVIIPGDVSRVSYYTNFFYNYPAEDFVFYLNDRLLYSEKPDGKIMENGIRNQLLMVMNRHKLLKTFIQKSKTEIPGELHYQLSEPLQFQKAKVFLKLMGLTIHKNAQGLYIVDPDTSPGAMHYFQFALSYPKDLQILLNKTGVFHFTLKETRIELPWSCDFLRGVTGLPLDEDSLFLNLLGNERFSLLLGTLYRLADAEIEFMGTTPGRNIVEAWREIYNDPGLLMGMYVLSSAVRVIDNRLLLPGGDEARQFWAGLVGKDPAAEPFEFLKTLAVKDNGKLNYLYVFSFFCSPDAVRPLLFKFDVSRMTEIMDLVRLGTNEKINGIMFPELDTHKFYTLLYGFHVKDGEVDFPGGTANWLDSLSNGAIGKAAGGDLYFALVKKMLEDTQPNPAKFTKFQKLISIYNKFYYRPGLLNRETIWLMSKNYQLYNVLVDFIEKIPVKKPETIQAMFDWAFKIKDLSVEDRALYSAMTQSLLEILAESARYIPPSEGVDYDRLVMDVIGLPMERRLFYDSFFQFLETSWKIPIKQVGIDNAFAEFVLRGIQDRTLLIKDASYHFAAKEKYKDLIDEILQSQETCRLGMLVDINRLLDNVLKSTPGKGAAFEVSLFRAFNPLPNPGISDNAPREVRDRFKGYSQQELGIALGEVVEKLVAGTGGEDLGTAVDRLKSDFLIYHLKDYLLGYAYAVNAKNLNLKSFLNPNLIRLHDFSDSGLDTPWSRVSSQRPGDGFMGFYIQGGLSRLNLVFASNLNDHLFGSNYIYNAPHIQAVLINALDLYPIPMINHSRTYSSLLVQYGIHLIEQAGKDGALLNRLSRDIGWITAGFHYRKTRLFLEGKEQNHNLFYAEFMNLGQLFFDRGIVLDSFPDMDQLKNYSRAPLSEEISRERHRFGSIFYHTFGTLVSQERHMFPQEVANLYQKGWVSGEMINEFKVNVGLRGFQKKLSSVLSGHFLNHFLNNTCRKFYSQNHRKDYYSTYFVFDIINSSYLNKTIKNLNQEGYLRIK